MSGIKNGQARQIWKRYHLNKETDADRFAAHIYAMNTVKEVGFITVSFLLSLPPIAFGIGHAKKVFKLFDNLKARKQHLCLHLSDKTGSIYSIAFSYSDTIELIPKIKEESRKKFYRKWTEYEKKVTRNYDYSMLILQSEKIPLAKIYRNGEACPINDASVK